MVFLRLNGYKINIAAKGNGYYLNYYTISGIVFSVWRESLQMKKIINRYQDRCCYSDNRFGAYSKKDPMCLYNAPVVYKNRQCIFRKIASKIHYYFIKKYGLLLGARF